MTSPPLIPLYKLRVREVVCSPEAQDKPPEEIPPALFPFIPEELPESLPPPLPPELKPPPEDPEPVVPPLVLLPDEAEINHPAA